MEGVKGLISILGSEDKKIKLSYDKATFIFENGIVKIIENTHNLDNPNSWRLEDATIEVTKNLLMVKGKRYKFLFSKFKFLKWYLYTAAEVERLDSGCKKHLNKIFNFYWSTKGFFSTKEKSYFTRLYYQVPFIFYLREEYDKDILEQVNKGG